MRTIIAGSRSIDAIEEVLIVGLNGKAAACSGRQVVEDAIVRSNFDISMVISGTAKGVDRIGEAWAIENEIPLMTFPADWQTYGKRAGFVRNKQMAEEADALIAVWDGESPGTKMMIDLANEYGLQVYVAEVAPN